MASNSLGQIQCSSHFETSTRIWQKTKRDSRGIHFELVYPEKVREAAARLFDIDETGGKCMMCNIYPAFYLVLTPHHSHHTSTVCKEGCASMLYDFIKIMQGEEAANALKAIHDGESPDVHTPEKVIQMFGNMNDEQKHEAAELYYRMQMKAKQKSEREMNSQEESNSQEETNEEAEIEKNKKQKKKGKQSKNSFAASLSKALKRK